MLTSMWTLDAFLKSYLFGRFPVSKSLECCCTVDKLQYDPKYKEINYEHPQE